MKFSTLIISVAVFMSASIAQAAAEKIYKWKDEKGIWHYDQRPPYQTPAEVIKPQTGHSDPVSYSKPENEATKAANVEGEKAAPAKDRARCESARRNLETLKTYTRIRVKGDDGEFRFLTPDEQAQKIKEANAAIQEDCD